LLNARDRFDFGEAEPIGFTGAELREWWRVDEASLERDAWIAVRDGELVAYVRARRERDLANLEDESCVRPDVRGQGLGSQLLDLAETWSRERSLKRLHAHVVNEDGRRLLEDRGHELVRYFWRMEIELAEPPAEPQPPDGFAIRGYRPGTTPACT
jgi:GNAT superfamily N-acetyltransferase